MKKIAQSQQTISHIVFFFVEKNMGFIANEFKKKWHIVLKMNKCEECHIVYRSNMKS